MKRLHISFFILIILTLSTSGCSAEKFGSGIDKNIPLVKVKDVFLDTSLHGKMVILEGVISTQCQSSGCWFFLSDGTGRVFVNLAPKGFALPPKTGKKAKVMGEVARDQHNVQIIAHGIEIY